MEQYIYVGTKFGLEKMFKKLATDSHWWNVLLNGEDDADDECDTHSEGSNSSCEQVQNSYTQSQMENYFGRRDSGMSFDTQITSEDVDVREELESQFTD